MSSAQEEDVAPTTSTAAREKISALFGDDDSDDDDEVLQPAAKTVPSADASGLFGSESSSEDEEEQEDEEDALEKRKRKLKASAEKRRKRAESTEEHKTTKRKKTSGVKDGADVGDAYDSEPEVARTKDDDDFIDADDDLADVLGEYDNDKQEFADERPVGRDFEEEEEEETKTDSNFFDETLKELKSGRRRRGLSLSPQELEQLVQEILYRMDTAQTADENSISEGKPGLEKLKLLDTVVDTLSKVQLQSTLLDFNLLEVMRKWIQPTANGHLPNVGIRTKLLRVTKRLPVYKDHLKRSGFGKIVMALYKHPDETQENKEVCRELIERWSRSVFDKSMDYKRLAEYQQEKEDASARKSSSRRTSTGSSRTPTVKQALRGKKASGPVDLGIRVQIPTQLRMDFVHRPAPKFEGESKTTKLATDSRKERLLKRMQVMSRSVKKARAAIPMSVEGRNA